MPATSAPYTLADTWRLNNRVNLQLLGHLTDAQLASAANPRASSIADQLAHLHITRIMWLEVSRPAAFLGYMLAHEGHHRGQVILHLKHAKMPIPSAAAYGLWEWGKI